MDSKAHAYRELLYPLVGLVLGTLWFAYNLSLPPSQLGWECCDGAEYIGRAMQEKVWSSSGHRTFGYPFFLSLFIPIFDFIPSADPRCWISAAMVAQLIIWFLSAWILFRALRRMDQRYSPLLLGLLFAHPALTSYAAMPLTDSLSVSLFCLTVTFLLSLQKRYERPFAPCFGIGLCLGLITTMRPSYQVIGIMTGATISIFSVARGISSRHSLKRILTICLCSTCAFLFGFLPPYLKTAKNCYDQFGYFCLLDRESMQKVSRTSLFMSVTSVRWWSSGTTGFRNTNDNYMWVAAFGCNFQEIPADHTLSWLASCYTKIPTVLPVIFVKKIVAGFDNYLLNAYTTDETAPWERVLNRVFSIPAFLGFLLALGVVLRALFQRTILNYLYLVVPIGYLLFQVNFHIESRYFFPTYPLFFLFFFIKASEFLAGSWTKRICFVSFSVLCTGVFLFQTLYWDLRDCLYNYTQVHEGTPRYGLMLACPPKEEVDRKLDRYFSWIPMWPTP